MQSKKDGSHVPMGETYSTDSRVSASTISVTSSKITSLSRLKASTNQY